MACLGFCLKRALCTGLALLLASQALPAWSSEKGQAIASASESGKGAAIAKRLDRSLMDFTVTTYGAKDGAPTDIEGIAQTPDGFLWLAASEGLVRFDGITFTQEFPVPLPRKSISTLFVDSNGDLWIGYRFGGISRLSHGKLDSFDNGLERNSNGGPRTIIAGFVRDKNGVLWVADGRHLYRLTGNNWHMMAEQDGYPLHLKRTFIGHLRDGTLWVSDGQHAWNLNEASRKFESIDYQKIWEAQFGISFDELPSDAADMLRRLTQSALPAAFQAITVDQSSAIWSAIDPAITRYRWVSSAAGVKKYVVDTLSRPGIPYGDDVAVLFVDREGDVWAGELGALERFRPNKLKGVAPLEKILAPAMAKGTHGDVWVAANQHGNVYNVSDGVLTPWPTLGNGVSSVSSDQEGNIWFLGNGFDPSFQNIRVLKNGKILEMPYPEGVSGVYVNSIVNDPLGGYLLSSGSADSLYRLKNGVWSSSSGRKGLPPNQWTRLARDDHGRLWVGSSSSQVSVINGNSVENYTALDGISVGYVKSIDANNGEVWIGGAGGVNRLFGRRFFPLLTASKVDFNGAGGIAKTKRGELWINATAGLYRIPRDELEKFYTDPRYRVKPQLFDQNDGLQGGPIDVRPTPTLLADDEGKIWAARMEGAVTIDPANIPINTVAPRVEVQSISADDKDVDPNASPNLSPGVRTIRFTYTAPSLSMPEKVIFRYRLDGVDHEWENAGSRRVASYTNLGPGSYAFRVVAANEDGVWSEQEATSTFSIAPFFYQTWWFKLVAAVSVLLLGWLLFVIRLRQLQARFKLRMSEREDIARELHDTLLQGIGGMVLHIQSWAEDDDITAARRTDMQRISRYAGDMMVEGRDRIAKLRATNNHLLDLTKEIKSLAETYSSLRNTRFLVREEGQPRQLLTAVIQDVLDISREGIRNAFIHASAATIDVLISYGVESFSVCVTDDGLGLPVDVIESRSIPGHWGFPGMYERSRKLGAILEFDRCVSGKGTILRLVVPARRAYATTRSRFMTAIRPSA